nr:hypothetical protein [Candidatus Sigynarchaeota archaeon]
MEDTIMNGLSDLEAVLGHEEMQILRAIQAFPGDIESLHFITGIPRKCIEAKLAALEKLDYVVHGERGYELAWKDKDGVIELKESK